MTKKPLTIQECALGDMVEVYFDPQARRVLSKPANATRLLTIIGAFEDNRLVGWNTHVPHPANGFNINDTTINHSNYTYLPNILDFKVGCWLLGEALVKRKVKPDEVD